MIRLTLICSLLSILNQLQANSPLDSLRLIDQELHTRVVVKQQFSLDSLAIESYQTSLLKFRSQKDSSNIVETQMRLSGLYTKLGDFNQALEVLNEALIISEMADLPLERANLRAKLGAVYANAQKHDGAISNYLNSAELYKNLGEEHKYADVMAEIALCYEDSPFNDSAMFYHQLSLQKYRDLEDEDGIAKVLSDYSRFKIKMGMIDKAEEMLSESITIRRKLKQGAELATTYHNMALLYEAQGKEALALDFGRMALAEAKAANRANFIAINAKWLYAFYKGKGDFQKALIHHEMAERVKDSLKKLNNDEAIIRQEFRYHYQKKAIQDSLKSAQEKMMDQVIIEKQEAELKAKKSEQYLLFGGIGMLGFLSIFIFNRFKLARRQKEIIESQKMEVENAHEILQEKSKEIMDSIRYAKRIQGAILPSDKQVKQTLEDAFILYKPKDVVAGDFYWMSKEGDTTYFAAADCTGHGVPGAMVSVVCNNALNRAVKEFGIKEPGKILDKTRELVVQEFEKSDEKVADGMDIALCALRGNELYYAGAHNPLWIIPKQGIVDRQLPREVQIFENGESEHKLLEIKADKQPIGKFEKTSDYQTHHLHLEKGDTLYLFSDGYADQFGGLYGKKFKTVNFKKLLLSLKDKAMDLQASLIDKNFEDWRGDQEQIDDVCVIGVRV